MGLKVHSLGRLPAEIDREYFVYLLDYGWDEPLGRALRSNFDRMASLASRRNALVIAGFDGHEFTNEVFSWHRINGSPGDDVLPAILITTCHPHRFAASNEFPNGRSPDRRTGITDDRVILIPLKEACRTETDVTSLIEKVFRDIEEKKALTEFDAVRHLKKGEQGALVDALILKPAVAGVGIDLKAMARFFGAGKWIGKG